MKNPLTKQQALRHGVEKITTQSMNTFTKALLVQSYGSLVLAECLKGNVWVSTLRLHVLRVF